MTRALGWGWVEGGSVCSSQAGQENCHQLPGSPLHSSLKVLQKLAFQYLVSDSIQTAGGKETVTSILPDPRSLSRAHPPPSNHPVIPQHSSQQMDPSSRHTLSSWLCDITLFSAFVSSQSSSLLAPIPHLASQGWHLSRSIVQI